MCTRADARRRRALLLERRGHLDLVDRVPARAVIVRVELSKPFFDPIFCGREQDSPVMPQKGVVNSMMKPQEHVRPDGARSLSIVELPASFHGAAVNSAFERCSIV